MAKRRNAPALFELLRDSNSTRTGQIGAEQLRNQLGGGTVKNTAPRPPGHPSLKEPAPESTTPVTPVTPIAAQVPSDAVVESKQPAQIAPASAGPEVDPLLAMPTFRAGRPVTERPEPKPQPADQPLSATQAAALVPPQAPKPTRVEVASPPAPKPQPKPQPQKAPPKPAPEPAKPESSALIDDTDPQTLSPDAPALPLFRRIGNQLTFSTPVVGMAVAAALVLLVIAYVLGTLIGNQQARSELEPQLQQQAESTLSGLDAKTPPGQNPQNEASNLRPVDPMVLARDPAINRPITIENPPAQTPAQTQPEPAPSKPAEITNTDTREAGLNYLHLAPLADPEEARRLQIFLAENGIQSFVREQYRGGRLGHELITLVGIPPEGWSTSTRKMEHVREVQRLGGIWFKERGGSIDYSLDNQSQWYKATAAGS